MSVGESKRLSRDARLFSGTADIDPGLTPWVTRIIALGHLDALGAGTQALSTELGHEEADPTVAARQLKVVG